MTARIHNPRWMWILAAVLGVGCSIAFAVGMLATPDHSDRRELPVEERGRSNRGFGVGLVLGLGAGIAVGFAIARGHTASEKANAAAAQSEDSAHSSRNSP